MSINNLVFSFFTKKEEQDKELIDFKESGSAHYININENTQNSRESINRIFQNSVTNKFVNDKEIKIRSLVTSGGGAKGAILPGVFNVLETHGVIEDLIDVAGSSVGALTMAFLAVGLPSEEIKKISERMQFKELFGSATEKKIRTLVRVTGVCKDGKPLLEFLKKELTQAIFTQKQNIFEAMLNCSDENLIRRVSEFLCPVEDSENATVTFQLLADLHTLIPEKFKKLHITGTRIDNASTIVFDAENTPHLPVAFAVRASVSLPVLLEPYSIPVIFLPNEKVKADQSTIDFMDGGYYNNIPVNLVPQGRADHLDKVVLVFDETKLEAGELSPFLGGDKPVYKASIKDGLIRNTAASLLTKNFHPNDAKKAEHKGRNTTAKRIGLEKIRNEYFLSVIPLRVDGITTSDFEQAKEMQDQLINSGKEQALAFLDRRRSSLTQYDNAEEAKAVNSR